MEESRREVPASPAGSATSAQGSSEVCKITFCCTASSWAVQATLQLRVPQNHLKSPTVQLSKPPSRRSWANSRSPTSSLKQATQRLLGRERAGQASSVIALGSGCSAAGAAWPKDAGGSCNHLGPFAQLRKRRMITHQTSWAT